MKLVKISEDNYKRLSALYDGINDMEKLSIIINNHLKVILDEIEEDSFKKA